MKFLSQEKLSQHKYKTPEGYLVCVDAILGRTGKQQYYKHELFGDSVEGANDIVDVDRPEKEVFDSNTLASFENKPITVEHPDENVTVDNYKDYAVGFVRDVRRVGDNIVGNLVITDKQTIDEIENGEHTDLSCGYDCEIIDDGKGDYMQSKIRGNHVALCQEGRAGNAKIIDSKINDAKFFIGISKYDYTIEQAKRDAKKYGLQLKVEKSTDPHFEYEGYFIGPRKNIEKLIDETSDDKDAYDYIEDSQSISNAKDIKDSNELANKIKELIKYINNINAATKGKTERYYIEDNIISIKKLLKEEFSNINKSKHIESDKVSMQASIRLMSGYFGELIKTLENMSTKVNDLTLSQFLKQQSYRLNTWKQTEFNVLDSNTIKDVSWDDIENAIFKQYNGPVHSEVNFNNELASFDTRTDASKLADWIEEKFHLKTDVVKRLNAFNVKVYGVKDDTSIKDDNLSQISNYVERLCRNGFLTDEIFKIIAKKFPNLSAEDAMKAINAGLSKYKRGWTFGLNEYRKYFDSKSVKDWSGSRENGVIYEYKDGYYYITHKNGHVEKVPENRFKNIDDLYYYLDSIRDSKSANDKMLNAIKMVNLIKKIK